MKIKSLIVLMLLALALPKAVFSDAVSERGINFLKSKQNAQGKITGGFSASSQWAAIAFAIYGVDNPALKDFISTDLPSNNTATEWESRILAVVAIDGNPSNFGGANFLQKLESFYNNNQIGDTCSVNDDIFGLLALIASGNLANQQIKTDTLNFIISKQDASGGFGFSAPGCPFYEVSADMTGAGLQALQKAKEVGMTHANLDDSITKAKNYLLSNQSSDGGFGYFGTSDPDSTGWVLMAFNALGMKDSPQAINAKNYLISKQSSSDGGIQAFDWISSSLVSNSTTTAQALIAFSGQSWIPKIFDPQVASSVPSTSVNSANLSSMFDNGLFVLPEGKSKSATPKLTLSQRTKITVASDSQSSVTLPSGTIITRADGQDIDSNALAANTVSTSSISGLSSAVKPVGVLQWGVPNISLSFSQPITLSLSVGTSFNGSTFSVQRSTSGTGDWTTDGLTSSTCVISGGTCSFQATKASYFVATQTVSNNSTSSSSSGSSTSSTSASSSPTTNCSSQKPGSAPTLLSAEVITDNQVKLTWSKAADPVTYYLVAYGRGAEKLEYGAPNVGGKDTTSFTVSGLSGGTTYYFKVRAGNECAPGDYSNLISVTPGGQIKQTPPEGFQEGVLAVSTASPYPPAINNAQVQSFKINKLFYIMLSIISFISAFVVWRIKKT